MCACREASGFHFNQKSSLSTSAVSALFKLQDRQKHLDKHLRKQKNIVGCEIDL